MGKEGLEPSRPCGLRILSPLRLPVPPLPRVLRPHCSASPAGAQALGGLFEVPRANGRRATPYGGLLMASRRLVLARRLAYLLEDTREPPSAATPRSTPTSNDLPPSAKTTRNAPASALRHGSCSTGARDARGRLLSSALEPRTEPSFVVVHGLRETRSARVTRVTRPPRSDSGNSLHLLSSQRRLAVGDPGEQGR
jgi:hypothetical protein